jgi:hypothetical protein
MISLTRSLYEQPCTVADARAAAQARSAMVKVHEAVDKLRALDNTRADCNPAKGVVVVLDHQSDLLLDDEGYAAYDSATGAAVCDRFSGSLQLDPATGEIQRMEIQASKFHSVVSEETKPLRASFQKTPTERIYQTDECTVRENIASGTLQID